MSQRKGETQRQYMDRLRAARGLPPMDAGNIRDQMMTEIRGAKTILSAGHYNQPGHELLAFMAIFHPDHPTTSSDELRRAALEMNRIARG